MAPNPHYRLKAVVILTLILAFTAITARPVWAKDPWYSDVSRHWAEVYIRALWSEEVGDGYVSTSWRKRGSDWYKHTTSNFKPDEMALRAQYMMLMAKVFRLEPLENQTPTFEDVPRNYQAYPGKPAFGFIEAAQHAGFIVGVKANRFRPDKNISRQDAVSFLIYSLDLVSYAESLTQKEVNSLLARYKDNRAIESSLRPHIAAATRLQIVEGYPDQTFKPTQTLTRAEAATIIYRSCLIRANAQPDVFFPDGDGVDDHTEVSLYTLKNSNLRAWSLLFQDTGGRTVASFGEGSFSNRSGIVPTPTSVSWGGTDSKGTALPTGTYFYKARVMDTAGQTHSSVLKPVVVASRTLRAIAFPTSVKRLETIQIQAQTSGWAKHVKAKTSTGVSVTLSPEKPATDEANSWSGSFVIKSTHPEGSHSLVVTAAYDGVQRNKTLNYEVLPDTPPEEPESPEDLLAEIVFVLIE